MTDRYAVIGNPVAHSKSPWIHEQFAQATGQDIAYTRIEAPLRGFASTVREFQQAGGRGANVTLPFKSEAFALCGGRVSGRAAAAQAVNTLLLGGDAITGDNTDGVGLVNDLARLGFAPSGRRVLLLGAGGAAQGVVLPLLDKGPAALFIANRTAARARDLARRFGVEGGGFDELAGQKFDIVVNATSGGLTDEAPPVSDAVFSRAALAYDMVYGKETPFLALARRAGLACADGTGMLVEQAAESFFLWRGVRPDTAPVLAALQRG